MPSASVMMREIRTPDCVESKKLIGSRATCASTRRRISVIARCAATPRTCDSANDVTAWMKVAAPAASARGISRSARCLPITSSIRYLDVAGRTSPETRLTSINAMPRPSRPRRAQMSALASCQAADVIVFFFGASGVPVSAGGACRRFRMPSDFGSRSPPMPIATFVMTPP